LISSSHFHFKNSSSILLHSSGNFRLAPKLTSQLLTISLYISLLYKPTKMPFKKITAPAFASLVEDLQLKAYPRPLLERLSSALTTRLANIDSPHHTECGPIDRPPTKNDRQKFTLWCGTASSAHEAFEGQYAFREGADLALLKLFSDCCPAKLAANPIWVPLEDPGTPKPNPLGLELHFVAENELGWLEDKYSGLALCFLLSGELFWLYVKAEVGDDQIPLAPGSELPLQPLVRENPPSGFKKFSLSLSKK
jgi:hypothetical protein